MEDEAAQVIISAGGVVSGPLFETTRLRNESPQLYAGVYLHYKGGLYMLLGVGQDEKTKELKAVYVSLTGSHLEGPRLRVRALTGVDGFTTPVLIDGVEMPHFTYLGNEIPHDWRTPDPAGT